MFRFSSQWVAGAAFAALLLAALACSLPSAAAPTPAFDATKAALGLEATSMALQLTQSALSSGPASSPAAPAATNAGMPTLVLTPTLVPTFTPLPTETAGPVTVVASGGNLNVRRGPGTQYDFVAGFKDGQTAPASARDKEGKWLYIQVPKTNLYGWVTTQTRFTVIKGSPMGLPLKEVAPAVPAYVINCTFDELYALPVGMEIPALSSAPDNQVQLDPGDYQVIAPGSTGNPQVAEFTLLEGAKIQLKKDGSGVTWPCP